ncbi:MAG TPA: hypothetical protein VN682_25320 [Terriglobales bacterium]|jgi:hypothetical protein|nr:hypothetical protein [Terriglobales bacterium]
MPEYDLSAVVLRVKNRTIERKVRWFPLKDKDGNRTDNFALDVDSFRFAVMQNDVMGGNPMYTFIMIDRDSKETILSETVRHYGAGRSDKNYTMISDLYEVAKRSGLDIDVKVAKVMEALDKL